MAKLIYHKDEITKILEKTGNEAFWFERKKTNKPHFTIDIQNNNVTYADNKIHLSTKNLQVIFNTKNPQKKHEYDDYIENFFNVTFSTSYDTDKEWYSVVYIFEAKVLGL